MNRRLESESLDIFIASHGAANGSKLKAGVSTRPENFYF